MVRIDENQLIEVLTALAIVGVIGTLFYCINSVWNRLMLKWRNSPTKETMRAAEQGDANAQFEIGNMYRFGVIVEKDDKKSLEWIQKAAKQGHIKAQSELGRMYLYEQNKMKAVEWLQKTAEQGDVDAQFKFGSMYEEGQGVEQNYIKAVEWFLKAAEQDSSDAQFRLGLIYQEGRDGIERDDKKAAEWYRRAAEQRSKDNYNIFVNMAEAMQQY
jgi:TPR repeat protein